MAFSLSTPNPTQPERSTPHSGITRQDLAAGIKAAARRSCLAAFGKTLPSSNDCKVFDVTYAETIAFTVAIIENPDLLSTRIMAHPRDDFPIKDQLDAKLKSALMNFLYRMYLQKKSDEAVMAEIARKNLQRMSREEWRRLKQFFRERELSTPTAMAQIRRKIGMAA